MRWKPRPSHQVRRKMIVVCDLTNYINKDLPTCSFRVSGGCAVTVNMWVVSYCRFELDNNHFSLHLFMSLSCRLHRVVDSTDLCVCLNVASLNIDSPIIMYNPPIIRTPKNIMNHKLWFHLIIDITIVWSYILFIILVTTERSEGVLF